MSISRRQLLRYGAAVGRLPDEAMRREIENYIAPLL
jgi:hypothetical protein